MSMSKREALELVPFFKDKIFDALIDGIWVVMSSSQRFWDHFMDDAKLEEDLPRAFLEFPRQVPFLRNPATK